MKKQCAPRKIEAMERSLKKNKFVTGRQVKLVLGKY